MTNPDGSAPSEGGGGYGGGDVLSTALQVGGMIYNAAQQRKNVKDTIRANKQEAQLAYDREVDMWNRANDYNSPSAQMARLQSAGLNPNLIYGSGVGGAAGTAAQSMPKYNAPTLQYNFNPVVDIPQVISMYQNFQMRQAQINNVKAQTQNIEARTLTEGFRDDLVAMQGKRAGQLTDHESVALPYKAGILANQAQASNFLTQQTTADLRKRWLEIANLSQDEQLKLLNQSYIKEQISGTQIQNEQRQADLVFSEFRNAWMKEGVTSSDHVLLRILVRIMNQSGLSPTELLGN